MEPITPEPLVEPAGPDIDQPPQTDVVQSTQLNATTFTDIKANKKRYFATSEKPSIDPAQAAKRFSYLLGLTDLFRHFLTAKAEKDATIKLILENQNLAPPVIADRKKKKTKNCSKTRSLQKP